jgi:hypothetical protein
MYAFFVLIHNEDTSVEIVLEDEPNFRINNTDAIEYLNLNFPRRVIFRQSIIGKNKKIIPNTIRFIEQPISIAEYIYIGDIDLLVFEDIQSVHLPKIKEYDLAFSNVVRDSSAEKIRLTGLHFCKYKSYYPLADISDLDLSAENDEYVLYELMRRKGFQPNLNYKFRPECGIHASLNRDPIGRVSGGSTLNLTTESCLGWGGKTYYESFLKIIKDPNFSRFFCLLPLKAKLILLTIESLAKNQLNEMHWLAISTLANRSIVSPDTMFHADTLLKRRSDMIDSGNLVDASLLSAVGTILWPKNIEMIKRHAWILASQNRFKECVELIYHLIDLSDNLSSVANWDLIRNNESYLAASSDRGRLLINELKIFWQ